MRWLLITFRVLLFTLGISSLVRTVINISIIPCIQNSHAPEQFIGVAGAVLLFLPLIMLEWSWIALLTMDSGSLESQTRTRGTSAIERFQPCPKCGLHKPPRCHHCSKCGKCILYMDHHCKALGICLAYRNFKAYILVLMYGAAASFVGSGILFVSLFLRIDAPKLQQFVFSLFCAAIGAGLVAFARVYLNLKKNNLTTIEAKFHMESPVPLASADVFERGMLRFLPLPAQFDPFEPFLRDLL